MINPVFLRTFMSLVKTNHFTHTAQALNMTQPGVSQHIKKLETQLGKELLSRHGKTFELTSAGERLYQYGLQQAKAESELRNDITQNDRYTGDCRLACSGSMAMQLYPELLGLQKAFPGLNMKVEAAPNKAIVERIRSNLSDMGIVSQRVDDPKLVSINLGRDELCLVIPAGEKSSWKTLLNLGFINHPDGHHYATQILEINYPEEFQGMEQIPETGYINQLNQILLPVSLGCGFTVLPMSSVDVFPYLEKVSIVKLTFPIKETAYLIKKKHRSLPSRYQLIEELLERMWQ